MPGPHLKSRTFKTDHMPCNSHYSYHHSFKFLYSFSFHSTLPCQLQHHSLVTLFSHNCSAHLSLRTLTIFSIIVHVHSHINSSKSCEQSESYTQFSHSKDDRKPCTKVLTSIVHSIFSFMLSTNMSLTTSICL